MVLKVLNDNVIWKKPLFLCNNFLKLINSYLLQNGSATKHPSPSDTQDGSEKVTRKTFTGDSYTIDIIKLYMYLGNKM